MPKHIALAYSGGLDTSVAVHWLARHHRAQVTAVIADLGQSAASLAAAEARALANGASECIITPAQEEFARGFLAPSIRANARYEDAYPLGTAIARPLIARILVDAAHAVGADAVAHGCTGKGNDQVRIENGVRALDPSLLILAPQRTHPMDRPSAVAYAKENGLQLPPLKDATYSVDENLWTRSIEGGDLEDPAYPVPEAAYQWTTAPQVAPAEGATHSLSFQAGVPVALDGEALPLAELVARLNVLAGAHGVGRIDHVESRVIGIKSREVYEAPAATVIHLAKKSIEGLTLTRDEIHAKVPLEAQFARLTYDGQWWTTLMAATQAFLDAVNANVTGEATLHMRQGAASVVARTSPLSLYEERLATYGAGDAFDHQAATGFLQLTGLPLATAARARATAKTMAETAPQRVIAAGGAGVV